MVSKYTLTLINAVEAAATVNRPNTILSYCLILFLGGESTHGRASREKGRGRRMAFPAKE
jgi:hypothetical protein